MLPASARTATCCTSRASSGTRPAAAAARAAVLVARRRRQATTAMAAAAEAPSAGGNTIILHVKGDPKERTLGDCPFCHRVLLTLECKGVAYAASFVDLDDKPKWLIEKAQGKVPLLERGGYWLPDSDEIVKFLEREFPAPSMAPYNDHGGVGAKLFPAFRGAILAEKGSDEEKAKMADVGAELDRVDAYLASRAAEGPFLGGSRLDAADASFAPKLYHAKVALPALKGAAPLFALAGGARPALARYWQELTALEAWQRTDYGEAAILAGWERHQRMHA